MKLVAIWFAALVALWIWWLQPEHNIGTFGFVLSSIVLAWVTLIPVYFIAIFAKSHVPSSKVPVPQGYRVAMVVTKVPSEHFSLVRETLEAMLRQTYPHDTWLADEDPSEEVIEWCRQHDVRISTRKDCPDYHRADWPRRARCKEGNLAYFYDNYGYTNYDIVVQLDADHLPSDGYLDEMLRPFADATVGYVSAPSICDRNADRSWSARGRLYVEGALHGALQAGYNGGFAPLCIGSHYAVRTVALEEIGGLGPELAEDHSTTLLMNAHGWRGVHALNAIAHGDGPKTFADMVTQEFQWSRSLMMILLQYTPKYYSRLTSRLKCQFVFSQLWYASFSLMMLLMFLLPLGALTSDKPLVNVPYLHFLGYSLPLTVVLVLMAARLRAWGFFRPHGIKVLSWEGILFLFARWPWTLLGTITAVRDYIAGTVCTFRVTPKGQGSVDALPLRIVAPYAVMSIVAGLVVIFLDSRQAPGYYIFALVNCLIYTSLTLVVLIKHRRENATVRADRRPLVIISKTALVGAAILVPMFGMGRVPAGLQSLAWTGDRTASAGLSSSAWATGAGEEMYRSLKLDGAIAIGAYDPRQLLSDMPEIRMDHIYVYWNALDRGKLYEAIERARSKHRILMVTIEPFTYAENWRDGGEELFSSIVSGDYDHAINDVCGALAEAQSSVLIRWGHEMDDTSGRYPWARDDPEGYVRAYRYFVDTCRRKVPQGQYVWSPEAKRSVEAYYPGDGYVDFVGFSAYALQDWDFSNPDKPLIPAYVVGSRYHRVSGFGMPIIIAELGVSGTCAYVRQWIRALDEQIRAGAMPLLKGVVYFNDKEPHTWGEEYGSPDWRVSADLLSELIKEPASPIRE